uniref:Uncharacterized protein n=1 Tax=Triticum urartu TaxID=4572 RepID=A0A8R7TG15_TRIUA
MQTARSRTGAGHNQGRRLQMPWNMFLSLLPPSFFTIFLASVTLVSASFSRFLTCSDDMIFLRPELLSARCTSVDSKNRFAGEGFSSSGPSSCSTCATLRSSWTKRFRLRCTDIMAQSASAAISLVSRDLAAWTMPTSSGMNPASPIAFLVSSDTWHSRCAAFRAQCCSVVSPLRRKKSTRLRKTAPMSRSIESGDEKQRASMARSATSRAFEERGMPGSSARTRDSAVPSWSTTSLDELSPEAIAARSSIAWICAPSSAGSCKSDTSTGTAPASATMYFLISSTPTMLISTRHAAHTSSPPLARWSEQMLTNAVTPPCAATAHALSAFSVSLLSTRATLSLAAVPAPVLRTRITGAMTPPPTRSPLQEASYPAITEMASRASSWTQASADSSSPMRRPIPSATSDTTTRTHLSSSRSTSLSAAAASLRISAPPTRSLAKMSRT